MSFVFLFFEWCGGECRFFSVMFLTTCMFRTCHLQNVTLHVLRFCFLKQTKEVLGESYLQMFNTYEYDNVDWPFYLCLVKRKNYKPVTKKSYLYRKFTFRAMHVVRIYFIGRFLNAVSLNKVVDLFLSKRS